MNECTQSLSNRKPEPMRQYAYDDELSPGPQLARAKLKFFFYKFSPIFVFALGSILLIGATVVLNPSQPLRAEQTNSKTGATAELSHNTGITSGAEFIEYYCDHQYKDPDALAYEISYHVEGQYFLDNGLYFVFYGTINVSGDAIISLSSEFMEQSLEYQNGSLSSEIDPAYETYIAPLNGLVLSVSDPIYVNKRLDQSLDQAPYENMVANNTKQIYTEGYSIDGGGFSKTVFALPEMSPKYRWDLLKSGHEYKFRFIEHTKVEGRLMPSNFTVTDHFNQHARVHVRAIRRGSSTLLSSN